jgi:predicted MFS family arabinose efflux permease
MFRGFLPVDRKLTITVAFIESLRLMGIFMILPVFTLYGEEFTSSGLLIGLAFGSYALTMAIFQIPFGVLADRIGRKQTIIIGLIFFVIGNLICVHPVNIYILILGRLVSGSGAISSVGTSMVQANVPENRRSTAMAIIGIPVGLSFLLGILLGPLLSDFAGISSIFLTASILGIIAIFSIYNIDEKRKHVENFRIRIPAHNLLLGLTGFIVSLTMMEFFYFLPIYHSSFLIHLSYPEIIFFPVLVGGLLAIFAAGIADRGHLRSIATIGLLLLLFSVPLLFIFDLSLPGYFESFLAFVVYLTGYSIYEITFPTLVSRSSEMNAYSTNFSVFNMFQHSGQLAGSLIAGLFIAEELSSKPLLGLAFFMIITVGIALLSTASYFKSTKTRLNQQTQ